MCPQPTSTSGPMEWYRMKLALPSWINVILRTILFQVLITNLILATTQYHKQITLLVIILTTTMLFLMFVIHLSWSKNCGLKRWWVEERSDIHYEQIDFCSKLWTLFRCQATKMSMGVDVCMTYERRFYFNLPEVQKALHANRTNLPYPWSMCSGCVYLYETTLSSDQCHMIR